MSRQLISLNSDLTALRDEGYEVAVQAGHLVIFNVPYVNADKRVMRGTLISVLEVSGDKTTSPIKDHKAHFTGAHPCDQNGKKLRHIEHSSSGVQLGKGLVSDHMFSSKPKDGYRDHHHKMQTYVEMISSPARAIDPSATARTHIVPSDSADPDPAFNYIDSCSTRAGIAAITGKLGLSKVGIVGLGGTGSYVLDLVSKTPVQEIHLFDGDDFLQHNAFRSPGAPSLETLRARRKKVDYFADLYSPMRKGIVPHAAYLDLGNLQLLDEMKFVFVCLDDGAAKKPIIERLIAEGIPFVDVGMGIYEAEGKLSGVVRVTANTPEKQDHFHKRVALGEVDGQDLYAQNIQIADLNALNATLAVIKWKKLFGFYADFENEHSSNYTIDGNVISNLDKADDV